jgi:hypothetical protein
LSVAEQQQHAAAIITARYTVQLSPLIKKLQLLRTTNTHTTILKSLNFSQKSTTSTVSIV